MPIALPFVDELAGVFCECDLDSLDLDLARLWQPWQGEFVPGRSGLGGERWFRLSLMEAQWLRASLNTGHAGDLLFFRADGEEPGDLVLGASSACLEEGVLTARFPAGDYLIALAGQTVTEAGRLEITAQPCSAPTNLRIRRQGPSLVLDWDVVPAASAYRVLGGATPEHLTEIAVVATTSFQESLALGGPRRVYRVQALCE